MNGLKTQERSGTPVPNVQNRERSLPEALLMFRKNIVFPGVAGYESKPRNLLAARAIRGTWKSILQLLSISDTICTVRQSALAAEDAHQRHHKVQVTSIKLRHIDASLH